MARLRRWTLAIAFALAIHAAPLVLMAIWPIAGSMPTPMSAPVVYVELTPRAAPPVPRSELPPGPRQEKAEAPKSAAVREAARPHPTDVAPLVLPAEPAEPVREAAKQTARETTAPPVLAAPPAPRVSSGQPTWEGLVLGALDKHKRYPAVARRQRQQGVPYIRFVIDRSGQVLSSRLERSSGFRALDDEAVALPKRAQPLPKPPDDVGGATIELVAPVQFFMK